MDGEEGREEPAGLTADSVPRLHVMFCIKDTYLMVMTTWVGGT